VTLGGKPTAHNQSGTIATSHKLTAAAATTSLKTSHNV